MPKPPPQPDFQALFFAHFGRHPKRLRYELRFDGSNLPHDVVFLSSLIHDAWFTLRSLKRRGTKLTIDLLREAWELGTVEHEGLQELLVAPSRLTIAGLLSLEWRFEDRVPQDCDDLDIQSIGAERSGEAGEKYRVVLVGFSWSLEFLLDADRASMVLQDQRKPRRYAELPQEHQKL